MISFKNALWFKYVGTLGHEKIPNLQIVGMEEGNNFQVKDIEHIIDKIIEENFLPKGKRCPF